MNVFILIGLIMTIAGIFLIMFSACILLALWGIKAAWKQGEDAPDYSNTIKITTS